MKLSVYGCRGSSPWFSENNAKYGGNTSCCRLDAGGGVLIFDCGSGLNKLLADLRDSPPVPLYIFVSHTHLDHIIGLASFGPLYDGRRDIYIYGAFGGAPPEKWLLGAFKPPYWSIALEDAACARFTEVYPGKSLGLPGDTVVTPVALNHPGGATGFRVDAGGKSFVYLLDNETTEARLPELSAFCRNADAVVFDAAYLPEDYPKRRGWGHSTWRDGVSLAERSGCGRLILSHFDTSYSDSALDKTVAASGADIARDGMELIL